MAQLKRSLEEKVETLKQLDNEIIDILEDEDEITDDIEVADEYKGLVYAAIIKAEKYSTGAPTNRSVSDPTVVVTSPSAVTPTVSDSAIATTSTGITATHTDDRESTASTHSTPVVLSVSRASTAV